MCICEKCLICHDNRSVGIGHQKQVQYVYKDNYQIKDRDCSFGFMTNHNWKPSVANAMDNYLCSESHRKLKS